MVWSRALEAEGRVGARVAEDARACGGVRGRGRRDASAARRGRAEGADKAHGCAESAGRPRRRVEGADEARGRRGRREELPSPAGGRGSL